jgi:integrase
MTPRQHPKRAGTTYEVQIWSIRVRPGKRGTSYVVRWGVAGQQKTETFRTRALADSFRADLLKATRGGEPFDIASGRPVAQLAQAPEELGWFAFACEYADMKWASASPNSRVGIAETLAVVTPVLLDGEAGAPTTKALRAAMYRWAANSQLRKAGPPPKEHASTVRWIQGHGLTISALEDPALVRRVLDALSTRMDGKPAAASTYRRKRAVFNNLLEYAVERGLLSANPLLKVKRTMPKTAIGVDPQVLVDRRRAEALLAAVAADGPSGQRLVAFFACIYYAALRPAEAVALRRSSLILPNDAGQWGELHLTRSSPPVGRAWSDSGQRHENRQLKHRAVGDTRRVPCHPRLVELLRAHLEQFETAPDGRIFRGARGGVLSESVYGAAWKRARRAALPSEEAASSMAARPYDLRHACVTTWLNATGDPAQVAAWAGHSVNVLLRVYVQCIAGRDKVAKHLIERALDS